MSISDQLREAVRACGSVYAVARDSGVNQSSLNRFMNGERDLRLTAVDKLANYFGLELRPRRTPRRPK